MCLCGDHHDVTLILQLGRHRHPNGPPNSAAPPSPPKRVPIPLFAATRECSAAPQTFSSHSPLITSHCFFHQPTLRGMHQTASANFSSHESLISSVHIAGLLYGAILLFEGTWAERGFSNRLARRVKRLFSLSLKSADHSHIMPHSARCL